jgi:hypothetical protein
MANLVTDAFTEAADMNLSAHTANTGQGWTENVVGSKKWRIDAATDRAKQDGPEATSVVNTVNADPATAEYDITVTIRNITGGDNQPLLLVGRFTDASNMYAGGSYRNEMAADKKIWKKVAGTVTELASGDSALVAGDTLKFEIRSATKKLYKNGVELLSTSDDALTSIGRGGLGGGAVMVAGHNLGAWFVDDFLLDEVAAAGDETLLSRRMVSVP